MFTIVTSYTNISFTPNTIPSRPNAANVFLFQWNWQWMQKQMENHSKHFVAFGVQNCQTMRNWNVRKNVQKKTHLIRDSAWPFKRIDLGWLKLSLWFALVGAIRALKTNFFDWKLLLALYDTVRPFSPGSFVVSLGFRCDTIFFLIVRSTFRYFYQ